MLNTSGFESVDVSGGRCESPVRNEFENPAFTDPELFDNIDILNSLGVDVNVQLVESIADEGFGDNLDPNSAQDSDFLAAGSAYLEQVAAVCQAVRAPTADDFKSSQTGYGRIMLMA